MTWQMQIILVEMDLWISTDMLQVMGAYLCNKALMEAAVLQLKGVD